MQLKDDYMAVAFSLSSHGIAVGAVHRRTKETHNKTVLYLQDDAEGSISDMQQLKLELAGYQSCCKQLGQELAEKDRELEGLVFLLSVLHTAQPTLLFADGSAVAVVVVLVVGAVATAVAAAAEAAAFADGVAPHVAAGPGAAAADPAAAAAVVSAAAGAVAAGVAAGAAVAGADAVTAGVECCCCI